MYCRQELTPKIGQEVVTQLSNFSSEIEVPKPSAAPNLEVFSYNL